MWVTPGIVRLTLLQNGFGYRLRIRMRWFCSGAPVVSSRSSPHRGVRWLTSCNKWHVLVTDPIKETLMGIGCFEDELKAAAAYDCAQIVLRGDAVTTNFDPKNYGQSDLEAIALVIAHRRSRQYSSRYNGVMIDKSRGLFKVRVSNGSGSSEYIGCFSDELLAAQAHDRAWRGKVAVPRSRLLRSLNFPQTSDHFNLDSWEQEPIPPDKNSRFLNVCRAKNSRMFLARIGTRYISSSEGELEAAQAYDRAALSLGRTTNFPPELYALNAASAATVPRLPQLPAREDLRCQVEPQSAALLSARLASGALATKQRAQAERSSLLQKFVQATYSGDAQELSALRADLEKALGSRVQSELPQPSASDCRFQPDEEVLLQLWPSKMSSSDSIVIGGSQKPDESNHMQRIIARDLSLKLATTTSVTVTTLSKDAPVGASKTPPARLLRDLEQVMQVVGGPQSQRKVDKHWPLASFEGGKEAASRSVIDMVVFEVCRRLGLQASQEAALGEWSPSALVPGVADYLLL
ncbi:unnamed protein product, partial [Polarella glacialis]